MSILRLEAAPHTAIDSQYIQSVDLTIINIGAEEYDVLFHGYNLFGVFHVNLFHLAAGAVTTIPDIMTGHMPFSLLLVTNINHYHTLGVNVAAYNSGALVALLTQENFTRSH
ncbi:hypothetical protein BG53_06380 [Paenibacillus darwinianus]|uniref:Uncharacterized protein n=1 Tax=Paenibacillus darwinianus TaxID=1380763 RepID=A0A9W5RZU4_9BACL|nr:hypothetical protein [Paenibacillus darwinianus]EXX86297.1 hypothetical protein CH50_07450 [Paenibacillus darwinianus]EXX86388.1 hypothetical protein BG53_06380 [Paenibacillus darwinianus]EXX90997.1 hypothetical protein BG52_11695 [Paenibacillus darwinianus]